jgi:hypothetical protein
MGSVSPLASDSPHSADHPLTPAAQAVLHRALEQTGPKQWSLLAAARGLAIYSRGERGPLREAREHLALTTPPVRTPQ